MQIPDGFLGTDADFLMDLLVTVVPVVLVILGISWLQARRKQWTRHRNIQVALTAVLTVAVIALEVHIATGGGLEAILGSDMEKPGLRAVLRIHFVFAVVTACSWLGLVATSLIKFPNPPEPGSFSTHHRRVGRFAMFAMVGTGVTAVALYLFAFVL